MSFLGTLFGEIGKVAVTGLDAAAGAQASKAQAKWDRKNPVSSKSSKDSAASTCTPCAARARVEAARQHFKRA